MNRAHENIEGIDREINEWLASITIYKYIKGRWISHPGAAKDVIRQFQRWADTTSPNPLTILNNFQRLL